MLNNFAFIFCFEKIILKPVYLGLKIDVPKIAYFFVQKFKSSLKPAQIDFLWGYMITKHKNIVFKKIEGYENFKKKKSTVPYLNI